MFYQFSFEFVCKMSMQDGFSEILEQVGVFDRLSRLQILKKSCINLSLISELKLPIKRI